MTVALDDPKRWIFSQGNSLPSQPDSLWKVKRGIVRTLTWTKAGTVSVLGSTAVFVRAITP